MKGKRYDKSKINNNKIVSIFICAIFIITLVYSGFKILNWFKENKQTNKVIERIKEAVTSEKDDDEIDFESLSKQNEDVVAWLKVNGTNIDYPVVKCKNNDYYLTHSFDKSYNLAGWVFADYKNKFDNTDKNIVIYAHNRKDESLFGSLKKVLKKEWQENSENYIIKLYTPDENKEYMVYSVYQIENEEYYITTSFDSIDDFSDFLKITKSRSAKDFGVTVKENDNVLTLSTCAKNNKYRVVLHAKEIK